MGRAGAFNPKSSQSRDTGQAGSEDGGQQQCADAGRGWSLRWVGTHPVRPGLQVFPPTFWRSQLAAFAFQQPSGQGPGNTAARQVQGLDLRGCPSPLLLSLRLSVADPGALRVSQDFGAHVHSPVMGASSHRLTRTQTRQPRTSLWISQRF